MCKRDLRTIGREKLRRDRSLPVTKRVGTNLKDHGFCFVSAMSTGSRGVVSEGEHRNGNEDVITMSEGGGGGRDGKDKQCIFTCYISCWKIAGVSR